MSENIVLNRIKGALADRGIQNIILAIFLDVHETTVSDWCTNTNQPNPKDFRRIAEFLNLNVRDLIISVDPIPNNLAELMNAEHAAFIKDGNSTYITEGATKTKKGKKIINPELVKRLRALIKKNNT